MDPAAPERWLSLLDWKRRVFELYGQIRSSDDPRDAWLHWRTVRDDLFAHHQASPIATTERFSGLSYFDYDPDCRVIGCLEASEAESHEIPTSHDSVLRFSRIGVVRFALSGDPLSLELYWVDGYGGGAFLPFRDLTSGAATYGAGRYLIDTIKGADLGGADERVVLDFNFAYNPSCAYDPRWTCPLAPPANRLPVTIEAGEKAPPDV